MGETSNVTVQTHLHTRERLWIPSRHVWLRTQAGECVLSWRIRTRVALQLHRLSAFLTMSQPQRQENDDHNADDANNKPGYFARVDTFFTANWIGRVGTGWKRRSRRIWPWVIDNVVLGTWW